MSGYLMALTAVFFWSINIIIASYFATTLEPFEIAFGRWFIACLILVPMAWSGLKRNFRLLADNWLLVVSLAITGIVLDNTLIYYAGRTASAIDMGLLDVTGPIFLVILSRIFLKTPISGPADCRFADRRIRGVGNHFARRLDADCTFQICDRRFYHAAEHVLFCRLFLVAGQAAAADFAADTAGCNGFYRRHHYPAVFICHRRRT